ISAPVDASHDRLIAELRAVQEKAELEDESKIVDSMITAELKKKSAVRGVPDTLEAVLEGRVYRLIIARDFHIEGKECDSCHVLVIDANEKCSFCGGTLEPAPDLINRVSHRVLDMKGKVQLVSGE